MWADARYLAWDVLIAVEGGAFADAALARRLRSARLDTRDRALAVRLVYGTLAWQAYLDHIIAAHGRPPAQLDPPIRTLLRMALFQLTKLSRVPDFAVVDTAVELSKGFRRGAASGLVNALLRRFLREERRVSLPATDDLAGHLAVALSHPRWLVDRWLSEYGRAEAEALLRANNEPAPTVIRVNRLRADRQVVRSSLLDAGVAARLTVFSPDGIIIESAIDATALPGYAAGMFTVQSEASQLVAHLLGVEPGAAVLDACAAPGGKATHVAERLGDRGRVVALDRNLHGLENLRRMTRRLGLVSVAVVRADASALPLRPEQQFDAVLLDAPCSGLGTLRQHPEIRWRRTPAQLAELGAAQLRLLAALAPRVCVGGALVYATCTLATVENEEVVHGFLASHPDFVFDDPSPWLPPPARRLVDRQRFLRTLPHRDGLDGFFAVRLKRRR